MRVSAVIRKLMDNADTGCIFTNKYKHTRTVKCYLPARVSAKTLENTIRAALADIDGLKFKVTRARAWCSPSFIVSYPVDIVDVPTYLQK